MKILITGIAGFIGYNLARKLGNTSHDIIGIDNLNQYYDVKLKLNRLADLGIEQPESKIKVINKKYSNIQFLKIDITDEDKLQQLFSNGKFDIVIHLAAQAGVRYSLKNPHAYVDSNITGFLNILQACRLFNVSNLLYASTSSVYGLIDNEGNEKFAPLSEDMDTNNPLSFYSATKKANEVMAANYSNNFNMKICGMRFFTVYGPWGRPDMALFKFVHNILNDKEIELFNCGDHARDFTYIDDIVDGILILMDNVNSLEEKQHEIYNVARGSTETIHRFIDLIETKLGKLAIRRMMPMQLGDIHSTSGDIKKLSLLGYKPKIDLEIGIENFINWYKDYNKIKS